MSKPEALVPRLERVRRGAFVAGGTALALCVAGALADPEQFFRSYLLGYLFWLGISVGCLAIVMLHHLVGGGWGFLVRRLLESGSRTLWLMALLFVPLLFGTGRLYLWARPDAVVGDAILSQKSAYLNAPFFTARAVIYFAVWLGLAHFLNRWSLSQDRSADAALGKRLQALSGPGLLLYGLTVTFSAIDWVMSLEPHWFSTIYGMMFMVGYALSALAFVVAAAFVLGRYEPLSEVASQSHFHDLGNLLLALVMLWAYLAFSQFLIVWAENLAEEIPWYLNRTQGGWQAVAIALIVFQFAVPFLFLLSRATKRRAGVLAGVALTILFTHWVDLFWLIAPAFHPAAFSVHWLDAAATVGVGGVWIGFFTGGLRDRSLLPLHDGRLAALLEEAREVR